MGLSYPPSMFPGTATFHAPAVPTSPRGGVSLPGPLTGGTPVPCYCEPYNQPSRGEGHTLPEGVTPWYVFTPTDPGADVDWRVVWNGRTLAVTSRSTMQDDWNLWRTSCNEVT